MSICRVMVALLSFTFAGALLQEQANAQGLGGLSIGKIIDGWDGSLAAGLNSRSGNVDTLDGSGVLNAVKETDRAINTLQASYFYARNNDVAITDRFYALGRRDIKLDRPDWLSVFYQGWYEQDRFRNFDYRVALHAGLGILLYEDDVRTHKARVGAGASREFGGTNDDWSPELLLGYDYRRQLTEKIAIFANVDYFPEFDDFANYRLNTLYGAEVLLDPEMDLSLRFSGYDRYDSTPDAGNVARDTDYVFSLVWGF